MKVEDIIKNVEDVISELGYFCTNTKMKEIAKSLVDLWNEGYFINDGNIGDEKAQKDLFDELFTELVKERI